MLSIEKGIPIPEKRGGRGRKPMEWTVALLSLEIGDSIFAEGRSTKATFPLLTTARKSGMKFTTRCMDGGCRIWRVA
jgi:hypothetical protein